MNDAAPHVLLLLHGYEDEPVGKLVPPDLDPRWQVREPRGPVERPGGPAWFATDDDGPVESHLLASLDRLDALVGDLPHGARVVVGGSSQGGAVALAWALRAAASGRAPSGVFCINGWLPPPESFDYRPAALVEAGTRALVVGSTDDEVVPVQAGRSAARYLERAGVTVEWVELAGDHRVGPDAVGVLGAWLSRS